LALDEHRSSQLFIRATGYVGTTRTAPLMLAAQELLILSKQMLDHNKKAFLLMAFVLSILQETFQLL
jgi:hypothetical protein